MIDLKLSRRCPKIREISDFEKSNNSLISDITKI
jgi:hypothetical protein